MLWGYGPAVDILQEIDVDKDDLKILIVGGADCRHVLQTGTLAKRYTHRPRPTNITLYVLDVLVDVLARQLLLLLTALEPPARLGLREKTRLWMELYGNTLVRPTTARYLMGRARQLVHLVTDGQYLARRLPLVSLDLLKYKERDALETVFQFWARERFEGVTNLWDGRLRHSLGTRYDSRDGVFDWDYYMRLKDIPGGSRINPREYKHWRSTGVAFTWLESEMTEPNSTLASGVVRLGDKLVNHGYLGDMVNPPYLTFGTDSEDQDLLQTRNGVNLHRSTDIVEANVRRLFHELEHQTPYRSVGDDRELGAVITELTQTELKRVSDMEPLQDDSDWRARDEYSALAVDGARVVLLPTTALRDLPRRPAFSRLFDVLWVSQGLTQRLTDDVVGLARDGATLLVETRKFLTMTTAKEKADFVSHVVELGRELGCQPINTPDPVNDYLVKLKVVR